MSRLRAPRTHGQCPPMDTDHAKIRLLQARQAVLDSTSQLDRQAYSLLADRRTGAERVRGIDDPDIVNVELALNRQLADGTVAALHAIEEALERVEAGTYGVCTRCGRDIPAERLELRPMAATCVPCAR